MFNVLKRADFKTNEVGFDIMFSKGIFTGALFLGLMEVCTDPCCPCYRAKFVLVFHPNSNHARYRQSIKLEPHEFYIDLQKQEYITNNQEKDLLPGNRTLAYEFINELTEENWAKLIEEFEAHKAYISDFVNLQDIKIEMNLSKARIKHDGDHFYFNQLFHFCLEYFFSNNEYTFDDKYCMDPKCPCTEVEITIIPCRPDGPDDIDFLTNEKMIIKYNYQKQDWRVMQESSNTAHDLNSIVPLMIRSIPRFSGILKKRHEIMRGIIEKNLNQNNIHNYINPVKQKLKIGRNSLCPCGSGKKYKKCCGK